MKEIDVQVLDISPERCRVALSLKRLTPNPWEHAATDFPVGTIHNAVITSVMSYGAFARIEAGVEGLIHGSEMVLAPNQNSARYPLLKDKSFRSAFCISMLRINAWD